MMDIQFEKFHGAGNDFIIIDEMDVQHEWSKALIEKLCARQTGIGADGFILIQPHRNADFKMVYFNSDGNESTMCGNGGRCAAVWFYLNKKNNKALTFEAVDGEHLAEIFSESSAKISMNVKSDIRFVDDGIFIDTGSPHLVKEVQNLNVLNVKLEGSKIRNSDAYKTEGININFVSLINDGLQMRTYERGVEAETLSCGTGTVAVAMAHAIGKHFTDGNYSIPIQAPGGNLKVHFHLHKKQFDNVWLEGPVVKVFKGEFERD